MRPRALAASERPSVCFRAVTGRPSWQLPRLGCANFRRSRQKDLKVQTFHSSGSIMSRSSYWHPVWLGQRVAASYPGHTMKKSKWVTASPVPRVANCAAAVLPVPSAS